MQTRTLRPQPKGFHGDRQLLRLVDRLAERARVFVETSSEAGASLGYVARKFTALECFSCEPDAESFAVAREQACVRDGVTLNCEEPRELLRRIAREHALLTGKPVFAWLDARGNGSEAASGATSAAAISATSSRAQAGSSKNTSSVEGALEIGELYEERQALAEMARRAGSTSRTSANSWPLREEVRLLTKTFERGFLLIDDFRVPHDESFAWDRREGAGREFDAIVNAIAPGAKWRFYYPGYSEPGANGEALCGWGLLQFTRGSEELERLESELPGVCRLAGFSLVPTGKTAGVPVTLSAPTKSPSASAKPMANAKPSEGAKPTASTPAAAAPVVSPAKIRVVTDEKKAPAPVITTSAPSPVAKDAVEEEIVYDHAPGVTFIANPNPPVRKPKSPPSGMVLGAVAPRNPYATAKKPAPVEARSSAPVAASTSTPAASRASTPTAKKRRITLVTFGFKYGLPNTNYYFDVSFVKNPARDARWNLHSEPDEAMRRFVLDQPNTQKFLARLAPLLSTLVECDDDVRVGLGCNSGRHRSIIVAQELARRLSEESFDVRVIHREEEYR